MAITQDEIQNIVSLVLSSLRTNSRTIEQLARITELSDDDLLEINGGRAISAQGVKSYLTPLLENFFNEIVTQEINSSSKVVPSSAVIKKALEKLSNASIEYSEIDNIAENNADYIFGNELCRLLVKEEDKIVGVLDIISDTNGHLITEIFTTHYTLSDGELTNSHEDSILYTYYRSYGVRSRTLENGKWTKWRMLGPKGHLFYGIVNPSELFGNLNPSSNAFYIGFKKGQYNQFGGLLVPENGLHVFTYDITQSGQGEWRCSTLFTLSQEIDDSEDKIPTNAAVKKAIDNVNKDIKLLTPKKVESEEALEELIQKGNVEEGQVYYVAEE